MTAEPVADCHVHVFDPARFPYRQDAAYIPGPHETATAGQLIALLDSHGLSHALLVTPTAGYAPDNRAAEAAVAAYPDRLKAIAVVEPTVSEGEIDRLAAAGVVGLRFDLITHGPDLVTGAGRRLLSVLRDRDLVLDIQTEGALIDESLATLLSREAGRMVVDHMGRPDPDAGLDQPGFADLLRLAERTELYAKLSGPFRFSTSGYPYRDADPFAAALLERLGPERCVWGSDWPYVRMARRVDYAPCLADLARWVGEAEDRRKVLWETPRQLFGFDAAP